MTFATTNVAKLDWDSSLTGVRIFTYREETATIAAMKAAGYFNDFPNLRLYDQIVLVGSDGTEVVYVSQAYDPTPTNAEVTTLATVGSHKVFAAGIATTTGGSTTENIVVTGAVPTDVAIVTLNIPGAAPVTVNNAAAAADAITVVYSADPSTDTVVNYMLLKSN